MVQSLGFDCPRKPKIKRLPNRRYRQLRTNISDVRQTPKLPALGFAGFEDSPAAAGRPRRKAMWSLRPVHEPSDSQAADAGRFVKEAQVLQGLGRKPTE